MWISALGDKSPAQRLLFTDKTVDYIKGRRDKEQPFFAFVPFNGPYGHWPSIKGRAENEFAELYDNAAMSSIQREGLDSKVVDRFGMRASESGGHIREQFKGPLLLPNNVESLRNYFSQVSLIDHGIGKIENALVENGMLENTLVIYTSDHGFSLGHNGIWGHGLATWPATTHRPSFNIPLIMSGGPIKQRDMVCSEMISQIDLFPTVLSLAGIEAKTSMISAANNWSGYLARQAQSWPEVVYMEQEETRAVRTKQWLYMKRFNGSAAFPLQDEFYELESDPNEKHNLIATTGYENIKLELNQKIDDFFSVYSTREYDLWSGGSAKSNVSMPRFWKDAWGDNWTTEFS